MSTLFERWMANLEERHLADLQFSETARALRALSTTYVERRERLESKSAFDSAGKRAAYALYYSPLHFLTVQNIAASIDASRAVRHILDVGCGAGAAGAAWAATQPRPAPVTGLDTHPWALNEAALTYRAFGLEGSTRRANVLHLSVPRSVDAIAAGWVLNEVTGQTRLALQRTLLDAVKAGRRLLVVEPIATRISPWWDAWAAPFIDAGARVDEWRFRVELPDIVQRLGRAAGLRQEALTARSLLV